jgi:hypothetical protein
MGTQHIGNLNIVHADIKPDNILVSEGFSQVGPPCTTQASDRAKPC